MSKKQINLLIGVIILIVAAFSLFFSNDSSTLSPKFSPIPTPKDVYEKEVLGESSKPSNAPIPTNVLENPNVSPVQENPARAYEVVKVVDGDTVDVNIDGSIFRLRLIGVDTPETVDPRKSVQCFGREASDKSKELLLGQFVTLESDESQGDKDKYKRLLRYIFLPDGINFNKYMISEGYAYEYTYDQPYKYQSDFKEAQQEARNNNKGLWSKDTCSGNK